MARATLQLWILKEYAIKKVRKLIGNNRAERALREHVVLRKILGTLRNSKGTSIHERIMTVLATWGQRGLNSH